MANNTTPPSSRRTLARQTPPVICYAVSNLPPLSGSPSLYPSLRDAVKNKRATLSQSLSIPPCDALSFSVPQGHLFRVVCTHGPQVADLNCWSLSNPKERFYSSKTRQIHATHLSTEDRLWSCFPYMRPLATIVEDTINYGFDEDGAGVHDVIGSRCDPYTNWLLTGRGEDKNDCCHSNLTRRAVSHDGMMEGDVHDVLNVFMCTGFTKDTHQYFTKPSPVEVGDYLEFLAETDLLVSVSTCPQGDVSLACAGGGEPVVYPLGIEVWKPEEGWLEREGWRESEVCGYAGNHAMS